ncbi:pyridoxal phosphate-dependent transferase [Lipomyces mesembrius]
MGAAMAVQSSRSYATSTTTPLHFDQSSTSKVNETSIGSVHAKAGVFDTSKCSSGCYCENVEVPPAVRTAPSPQKRYSNAFNYEDFYQAELTKKHKDKSYRYFNNINRLAKEFPKAHTNSEKERVTVWCSNDYLGMSKNKEVLKYMHNTLDKYGHAILHSKEAALVFSSCYVANDATLSTLGSKLPSCVMLSDQLNHASMIQGIRHSGARKIVFKHNDLVDLENKLKSLPIEVPKIIAFESVYSMYGSIAPIEKICDLADKYGAITVHAVGMYGPRSASVAEHLDFEAHANGRPENTVMSRVDIITGTLGRAYGCVGGYIAGSAKFVDMIRSLALGFLFSTSLPPAIMAGANTAIEYQKMTITDRAAQQLNTRYAINYPTVPVGEERLRVTPTPGHGPELADNLVNALETVWTELGIKRVKDWEAVGGLASVGVKDAKSTKPTWTDAQLVTGVQADKVVVAKESVYAIPIEAAA